MDLNSCFQLTERVTPNTINPFLKNKPGAFRNMRSVFFVFHGISVYVPPFKPDKTVAYCYFYGKKKDITRFNDCVQKERGQLE